MGSKESAQDSNTERTRLCVLYVEYRVEFCESGRVHFKPQVKFDFIGASPSIFCLWRVTKMAFYNISRLAGQLLIHPPFQPVGHWWHTDNRLSLPIFWVPLTFFTWFFCYFIKKTQTKHAGLREKCLLVISIFITLDLWSTCIIMWHIRLTAGGIRVKCWGGWVKF